MGKTVRFPRRLLSLLFAVTLIAGSLGGVSTGLARAQVRDQMPETASYVPASALAYVTANLDERSGQWQQANLLGERLGQSITPSDLFDLFSETVLGGSGLIDVQGFLGGDVAFALTDPDVMSLLPNVQTGDILGGSSGANVVEAASAALQTGYVLIALPKDPSLAEIALRAALTRIAENNGLTPQQETQDGITISFIPGDEATGRPGFATARVDDALIAAPTVKDLLPVLDLRVNGGDSLADSVRFKQVIRPLPSETLALGAINGSVLGSLIGPEAEQRLPGINAITNGIKAFTAFSVTAVENGFQTDSRSAGIGDGKIFGTADNFDPTYINQMPAETQIFADGFDFGATGLLDAVGVVASQVLLGALAGMSSATPVSTPDPETVTLQQASNDAFGNLALLFGVNLKSQLIDSLDGEYALGVWGIDSTSANGVSAAFIAHSSDPAAVDSSLNALTVFLGFAAQGSTVTTTTIDGVTMNRVTLGSSANATTIDAGVNGDQLVVGIGDGAQAAISGSNDRLADTDLFKEATASLPTERNAMLFVNLESLAPVITESAGTTMSAANLPPAYALVGFKDNVMAASQGLLYVPA